MDIKIYCFLFLICHRAPRFIIRELFFIRLVHKQRCHYHIRIAADPAKRGHVEGDLGAGGFLFLLQVVCDSLADYGDERFRRAGRGLQLAPAAGLQAHLAVSLAEDPADECAWSLRGRVLLQRPDAAAAAVDARRRHLVSVVLVAKVVVEDGAGEEPHRVRVDCAEAVAGERSPSLRFQVFADPLYGLQDCLLHSLRVLFVAGRPSDVVRGERLDRLVQAGRSFSGLLEGAESGARTAADVTEIHRRASGIEVIVDDVISGPGCEVPVHRLVLRTERLVHVAELREALVRLDADVVQQLIDIQIKEGSRHGRIASSLTEPRAPAEIPAQLADAQIIIGRIVSLKRAVIEDVIFIVLHELSLLVEKPRRRPRSVTEIKIDRLHLRDLRRNRI